MTIRKKPLLFGFFAALALLLFYFAVLSIAQSFSHALAQFKTMWYWIFALAIGFGIQAYLYSRMTNACVDRGATVPASFAASGGVSGAAMAACCAHHVTDFVPLLGVSAAALFLTKYQTLFIVLGVLSNINGTLFMLKNMKEHRIAEDDKFFNKLYTHNISKIFGIIFASSFILFIGFAFFEYYA